MKRLSFALAPLWLGMALHSWAVDLTPRYVDTFIDGINMRRLFFTSGDTKIGVSVDRETKVEPGGGGVIFRFTKFEDARLLLKHSPMTPDQPFEGLGLERYREAAHRLLPVGAKDVKTLEEAPEPITINRWHSYRMLYSCDVAGHAVMQSVTFLNLDADEQLVLITTSHETDFREAAARSWQIIRTWQPLLPGDERPPTKN